jgi:hypothetical protein
VTRHPARLARSTLRLAALACSVVLLTTGCGVDGPRGSADASQSESATDDSAVDGYAMPDGWPIERFPLPPGGSVEAPNTTEDMVYLPVAGVETDVARAFYAETLPAAGVPDTKNANLAISRYEGKDLRILVQDDGRGIALVTITRGDQGAMQVG